MPLTNCAQGLTRTTRQLSTFEKKKNFLNLVAWTECLLGYLVKCSLFLQSHPKTETWLHGVRTIRKQHNYSQSCCNTTVGWGRDVVVWAGGYVATVQLKTALRGFGWIKGLCWYWIGKHNVECPLKFHTQVLKSVFFYVVFNSFIAMHGLYLLYYE